MDNNIVRFCILVGSARYNSNSYGIAKWVNNKLKEFLSMSNFEHNVIIIDPLTKPHPVNPVLYEIPLIVKDTAGYTSEEVQEWSKFIQSCNGLIVVTPEYNGMVPSTIKLAFDSLFFEWGNKPAAIVTLGSNGGNRVDDQLRQLMKVLSLDVIDERVQIKLPMAIMRSGQRLDENNSFLDEYKENLNSALTALIEKTKHQANGTIGDIN